MRRAAPRRAALATVLACAMAAGGCAAPPAPQDRGARVQTFLDAGNQAYRAGDYALAARRYAAAASLDPKEPACYMGLGMALSKLNRSEEARAAEQLARELAAALAAAARRAASP
jgi:Flp pilus assembly protein TadD